MQMNDRVAIVTGGGSGIGEALCHALAGVGARHVVVADLDGTNAQRVADAVGGTAATIDVADERAIVAMVAETEADHGPIGLFASNAGFVTTGGLEEPDAITEKMWQVHVKSHIYAARAVVPQMAAAGGGYLLNTASAAGLLTQVGSMAYSVTKGAAVSLAEWLAITHYHQGIRVSVLCPQAVETNIIVNSPNRKGLGQEDGFGVAGGDGVLDPAQVAKDCLDDMADERFWVLPHPEVATYVERKATDVDRWLSGMRRFQDRLAGDGPLPGDALIDG